MSVPICCCGTCRHFLPEVTDEKETEPATGWCQEKIPGNWLGWTKHKWKDGIGGMMVHAEGCCSDHEDKPCRTSQPSD